ncbi:ABC transporter substrate-binding protein [bacterium]|nr:ABC transporter substrate-binding protein [bacterium]
MRYILTLTCGLILIACGKSDKKELTGEIKPQYGGTLIYAKSGPPLTLDPALTKETESSVVLANLFDGLVAQRAGKTAIDPGLAHSWEISKDGLVYTFHLRSGVTFHNGEPLTAAAVIFSFERQGNPKHPFYWKDADYSSWKGFEMTKLIKFLRAINDSTVEITLNNPDATFLNILSHHVCLIVSPSALQQYGKDFYKHPVGTGPFRFASWNDDGDIVLLANGNYWNGRPYIDTLVMRSVPDAHQRWELLKAGAIDMMAAPSETDMAEIEKTPGIKFSKQPGLNISYLAMNMKKKPFTDARVRQAIVLAIDREKLVEEVFKAFGRSAKNPIPPMLIGYNDEIRPTPYDPAKARQLLTDAGFPNGFKTTLWTMPLTREYMPDPSKAATLIQKYLKDVGIEVTIQTFPWSEYLEKTYGGQHDMAIIGWVADVPDPDNFFYPLLDKSVAEKLPSSNIAFYSDNEMHQLILTGKSTADALERSNAYKKACEVFNRDLPWFTIAHSVTIVPMKEMVMDFQLHSTSVRKFNKLWLKK